MLALGQLAVSSGQAEHRVKPGVKAKAQAMHLLLSTDPDGLLVVGFIPCEQNFTYPMVVVVGSR